jgi:hypothetical protein
MVDGQHLPGQRSGGGTVTTVNRRHCPIEQLINRRTTPKAGIAVSRGTVRTVTHVDIVSSLVGTVCCIAQAIVHANGPFGRSPDV